MERITVTFDQIPGTTEEQPAAQPAAEQPAEEAAEESIWPLGEDMGDGTIRINWGDGDFYVYK